MQREVHADAEHSIANTVSHGCCRKDAMPFLGEKKGAILQSIVADQKPKLAVEVGTMAGGCGRRRRMCCFVWYLHTSSYGLVAHIQHWISRTHPAMD